MDWPVKQGWECETCGENVGLTWGLMHGICRCNLCHTQYSMRDDEEVVRIPVCQLKDEYKIPAQKLWRTCRLAVDEATDEDWDKAMAPPAHEFSVEGIKGEVVP